MATQTRKQGEGATQPLSPEEEARITAEVVREYYQIGTSTERADPQALQEAWNVIYRRAGREPVPVLVVPGPLAAHAAIALWQAGQLDLINPQVDTLLDWADPKQNGAISTWFCGAHEAYWVAWYRKKERLGKNQLTPDQQEQLDEYELTVRNGLWAWPYTHGVVVCDRPTVCVMEEFPPGSKSYRLHCETGPALAFLDGWKLYMWHGVRVSEQVIEAPDTLTRDQVLKEDNAEVRRAVIARMGAAKFVELVGAKPVDTDKQGNELYRIKRPNDTDLVLVRMINSSPEPFGTTPTGDHYVDGARWYKRYWERVHPELRPMLNKEVIGEPQKDKVRNAIASRIGLRGEQYAPDFES